MQVRPEPTRERLMDAAHAVFGRRGYPDTRIEDICQAAGSSRATFYRHFTGKDDVFDALLVRLIDELEAVAADVGPITPDRDGYERLHRLMGDLLTVSERWSSVVEALALPLRVPPKQRGKAAASITRASRRLGESIEAGGSPIDDPWTSALALVALTDGFGHQVRTWDLDLDHSAVVDAVTLLGLRMLHPAVDLAAVSEAPAA